MRIVSTVVFLCIWAVAARGQEFTMGLNYPWFIEKGESSGLFGELTEARRATVRSQLDDMASAGVRVLRVWTLAGAARWPESADGHFKALPKQYVEDLRWFVREAFGRGIQAMPVLWDFPLNAAHRDWIADDARMNELLDVVVEPLVRALADEPGIRAWDVMNEPEWTMRPMPVTLEGSPLAAGLARVALKAVGVTGALPAVGDPHAPDRVRTWVAEHVQRIHKTGAHATVGAVSPLTVGFWRGIGLDEYQAHYYPLPGMGLLGNAQFDLLPAVDGLGLDKPCLLGEFPANPSGADLDSVIATVRARGYSGALAWSYFGAGYPEDLSHAFSFKARREEFQRAAVAAHGASRRDAIARQGWSEPAHGAIELLDVGVAASAAR